MRPDGRLPEEYRDARVAVNCIETADGSALVSYGAQTARGAWEGGTAKGASCTQPSSLGSYRGHLSRVRGQGGGWGYR